MVGTPSTTFTRASSRRRASSISGVRTTYDTVVVGVLAKSVTVSQPQITTCPFRLHRQPEAEAVAQQVLEPRGRDPADNAEGRNTSRKTKPVRVTRRSPKTAYRHG